MKHFRKLLLLLGALAVMALMALPAGAVIITFDNLADGAHIDGVNLGGVTIFTPGGYTEVTTDGDYGVGWRSPHRAITNFSSTGGLNGLTSLPIVMVFDMLQPSVSVSGGDQGGDVDQFTVTAYDINGVQIAQVNTGVFGGKPVNNSGPMIDFYTVNLNVSGIKTVVVSDAINAGIGLDNIQFCNVPVPPTVLLLASGILGVLSRRRRA